MPIIVLGIVKIIDERETNQKKQRQKEQMSNASCYREMLKP